MGRIAEIDGLRAVAILAVFSYHTFAFPSIARITDSGWIGVDLFFVISGYLITSILLEMKHEDHYFGIFYAKRTLRIFPPYYALIAICFGIALFTPHYRISWRVWAVLATYSMSLFAPLKWYSSAVASLPASIQVLRVAWSLSIEEIFYLLWAPAIRFLNRRQLAALAIAAICLAPIIRFQIHRPGDRIEYFFFPARMDALAFGTLLALGRFKKSRISGWIVLTSLTLTGSMLFLIHDPQGNKVFATIGYSVVAMSMTLVLWFVLDRCSMQNAWCKVLRHRFLVWIGTVSYTFYLFHLLVIAFVRREFANVLVRHWAFQRIAEDALSFALALAISSLSWMYFEAYFLRLKSKLGDAAFRAEPRLSIEGTPAGSGSAIPMPSTTAS